MFHTTLRMLRQHNIRESRYAVLVKAYPGLGNDDHLSILEILNSNGLDDALWALRAIIPDERKRAERDVRLLLCDYAEHVLPIFERAYPGDDRPRTTIGVARDFAHWLKSRDELAAAGVAAGAAARVAARAAALTAGAAARDAETEWQKDKLVKMLTSEE